MKYLEFVVAQSRFLPSAGETAISASLETPDSHRHVRVGTLRGDERNDQLLRVWWCVITDICIHQLCGLGGR